MSGTASFIVTSAADLAADIALIDATGADAAANTAYTFNITANAALTLTSQLDAINLDSGSSLTIDGNGATLDGGGKYNGLFVYAGTVAINGLAIDNALAMGGNGAGGGAGLGGGLFIASAGAVTLTGVSFADDEAKGGGANRSLYGGGGLDGGNGNYGGGGVGLSASGGTFLGGGSPGIIIGAAPAPTI